MGGKAHLQEAQGRRSGLKGLLVMELHKNDGEDEEDARELISNVEIPNWSLLVHEFGHASSEEERKGEYVDSNRPMKEEGAGGGFLSKKVQLVCEFATKLV